MKKRFKFTKTILDRLPPHSASSASSNYELTDTEAVGLKLQVGVTARKFFYFRGTCRGQKFAIRLGEYGSISVEEAREMVRKHRAVLDKGGDPRDERNQREAMPLVRDFAETYIAHARSMGKRTYKNDIAKFRDHINPVLGHLRMNEVTTRDIQTLLANLKGKLSNATINRILALLSVFFNLAVAWELLPLSPVRNIKKLKENNKRDEYFTPEEVRLILAAAKRDRNPVASAAISALIWTGCRREEILQSRHENLNLERGTLYLPHTKSGRSRTVILNDAALDVFKNAPKVEGSPWIFPGRDPAKPLNNPTKAWRRILQSAGVKLSKLHLCRHTYASLLVNQGASLYQVQQLLGHASSATTQRYAHLASETLRSTSQLVANLVNESQQ